MNSNLFHNIANVLNIVLAAALAALMATGCTVDSVSGALECSQSWIPVEYIGFALIGINVLKLAVNVVRDGIGGLFKPQPPVEK